MANYRWNPYALLTGDELEACVKKHFTAQKNILFIMSKGFDARMNIALENIVRNADSPNIDCLLVDFDEGEDSYSKNYSHLVAENMERVCKLIDSSKIQEIKIKLWKTDGRNKRRIGDRNASGIIDENLVKGYTDIIVEISALPRGIYFSLLGKILAVIDNNHVLKSINLMVMVAENPNMDKNIVDDSPDEEPNFLHGFGGQIDIMASRADAPSIWLPILGEYKQPQISKAHKFLGPSETCPILPFPSRDPRRPDSLIVEYHSMIFDEFNVEKQNIMYVPEQNPFEAYKIISNAINNYYISLKPIGECKIVLSTFSSKLLSIGTLLTAYEFKLKGISVGVLNVDSQGYKIANNINYETVKADSNLFLIWLTGEPYEIN